MPNDGWAIPGLDHADDVEADDSWANALFGHIPKRKMAEFAQFAAPYRLKRCSMRHGTTCLHLANDQSITIAGNHIEFTGVTPPIPMQDDHALAPEEFRSKPLAVGTKGIFGCHRRRIRVFRHPLTVLGAQAQDKIPTKRWG
jgi:hypothetical protein